MSEPKPEYRIAGRPSTIFRAVHDPNNPYVVVNRRPIDNPALSFKAKGILTYLLSRPDGWEVSVTDLVKHGTDGAAAIRTGLKELRAAGHMHYTQSRHAGRITGWLIEVYEVPTMNATNLDDTDATAESALDAELSPDNENRYVANQPDGDFQQVENQDIENRTQVLSTLSNTDPKQYHDDEQIPAIVKLDEDYGTITTAWEHLHGVLTQPDALFLGELLDDWRAHCAQLRTSHPDRIPTPAEVVIAAVKITAGNAQNQRSHPYTKQIIKSWIQNGYGWKPVNGKQPRGQKYPLKGSRADFLAALEKA